jgi:hypothetical protein
MNEAAQKLLDELKEGIAKATQSLIGHPFSDEVRDRYIREVSEAWKLVMPEYEVSVALDPNDSSMMIMTMTLKQK